MPERTLTAWLGDERFENEREAVRAGILDAIREEAVRRGRELADATSEAILVCRKALRRDPDGKTASSLLSSLMRAREVEDRIQRLDEGGPTSITGIKLSDEDRAAFEQWQEERREAERRSPEQLQRAVHETSLAITHRAMQPGERQLLHDLLAQVGGASAGTLTAALRGDPALIQTLSEKLELARLQAEADAEKTEAERAYIAAPRPAQREDSGQFVVPAVDATDPTETRATEFRSIDPNDR